jgi:hypothetical protein
MLSQIEQVFVPLSLQRFAAMSRIRNNPLQLDEHKHPRQGSMHPI